MRPTLLAAVLTLMVPVGAAVAAPPSGTITCDAVRGFIRFQRALPTVNSTTPLPSQIHFRMKNAQSSCDAAGVVGGAAAIQSVSFTLSGRLPIGSNCAAFTGDGVFEKTKLTAKWKAGHRVIGTSKADLASVTYDSGAAQLVFVTQPIKGGAFAGSTLTFRFGHTQPQYDEVCQKDYWFAGFFVGEPDYNPAQSIVSVP